MNAYLQEPFQNEKRNFISNKLEYPVSFQEKITAKFNFLVICQLLPFSCFIISSANMQVGLLLTQNCPDKGFFLWLRFFEIPPPPQPDTILKINRDYLSLPLNLAGSSKT